MTGVYVVLWGKGKEVKKASQLVPGGSVDGKLKQVEIEIHSPSRKETSYRGGSYHGSVHKKEGGEEEEEDVIEEGRLSLAGSEVMGGYYLYR